MDSNRNSIYHFGVPGMKWGHRKYTTSEQIAKKRKRYDDALEEYEYASRKDANYKQIKRNYKIAKKQYNKELKKTNESYSEGQNTIDKLVGGKKTSARVNNYLNKGESLKSARTKAYIDTGAEKIQKYLTARKRARVVGAIAKGYNERIKGQSFRSNSSNNSNNQ